MNIIWNILRTESLVEIENSVQNDGAFEVIVSGYQVVWDEVIVDEVFAAQSALTNPTHPDQLQTVSITDCKQ